MQSGCVSLSKGKVGLRPDHHCWGPGELKDTLDHRNRDMELTWLLDWNRDMELTWLLDWNRDRVLSRHLDWSRDKELNLYTKRKSSQ